MSDLNLEELKQQLKAAGAKTTGNKDTLINRLRIWQSSSVNQKLYTTRIVPAIDNNNFPQIPYRDLEIQSDLIRNSLKWLSVSIISNWFVERKAIVGEKKGRNLFFNEFIKHIKYIEQHGDIYFKGLCSAETKKNVDYIVNVHFNNNLCQIMKASCLCPAGAGLSAACKHVSALIYAIECFVISGKLPTSSTSKIQTWHRPAGRKLENVSLDKILGIQDYVQVNQDITNYAINSAINFKIASPFLSSRKVSFMEFCREHDYCAEPLQYYILNAINHVSNKEIKRIEKNTRTHNKLWYETRSSRITASMCHNVIRTTNSGNFVDSFLKSHVRCIATFSNAIKWGLANETIAKIKYCKVTGQKIEECGIFIHPKLNFLAATPDGINSTKTLIIEIKCPYSVRYSMPTDAKYITRNGLIKSHPYFYQMQLQMCITGVTQCDFIVWTPKSIYIERIQYNERFVDEMVDKLTVYYKKTFCASYFKYKNSLG